MEDYNLVGAEIWATYLLADQLPLRELRLRSADVGSRMERVRLVLCSWR